MAGAAGDPSALFRRDGSTLHPTTLTRGPWDHGFLHGGAVCAAVGWALESVRPDPGLLCARMTVEIRSMVPLAPLETAAAVVKGGRRTQVLEATLAHAGRVLVRATSQWVAHDPAASVPVPARSAVPPRPDHPNDPGARIEMNYPRPGFNCDAVELRPIRGNTEDEGPGLVWVRLRHPVVEGEATSPMLALMAMADLGVAVGWERSAAGAAFINPDLTLQVNRPPQGDWVLMASRVHASPVGVGFCETVLSDDAGLFGRVLQSQVEAPPELGIPGLA
jgi:hypothetical protein